MDLALSDEQKLLQQMLRRVVLEKVAPRADAIDRSAEYPQDMFDLLRGLGLFALPFPARYGGTDSAVSACLAVEEIGRVCYNTGYLLLLQWVSFRAVLTGGSDAQKDRLLSGLADGRLRGAFSTTEPHAGSDVSAIRTRAVRVPGGYRIDGSKIWCSNASVADFVLVAARTQDESGRALGINLFIVERGADGFRVGRAEDKMGARGVPSCPLFLDGVFVPATNRLGAEGGDGFRLVMDALNAQRPLVAARAIGLAQGAMDLAIDYVKQRVAFDQPVAHYQGVRWMIADMAMQIEAARQLVYKAAALVDAGVRGRDLAATAAMAKCFASDVAMQVATAAVQLFGAAGISADCPIGRYFRDAKVIQIVEGTNQIQRNIIADSLLGRLPSRRSAAAQPAQAATETRR